MEEIKENVRHLHSAVFGDPSNPKERPGLVAEISQMDARQKVTNEILHDMRADIRKGVWIVLGAVIAGVLALVFKH